MSAVTLGNKADPAHPSLRNATGSSPRLDALTGIRGIAAWLVVLYHIRLSLVELFPKAAIDVFAKGYLAVDLFFVLSGFVLWCNYAERFNRGGLAETARFMRRRLARIWPLHAFILGVFVLLVWSVWLSGGSISRYPLDELPLNILLIHNWGFTSRLSWNHPSWSISTEFAAYCLFPFIAVAVRWDRLPIAVLVAMAVALMTALAWLFTAKGAVTLGEDIPQLGVWRCLAEFCLGAIACMVWTRWRGAPYRALWAGLCCVSVTAAGLLLSWPETWFVPAAFFTGILALSLDRGALSGALGVRPAVYLGEISYSTYLAHFLLFIAFKMAFVDETLQLSWLSLAGFLALLLAVSIALYHGVEKPAQRWLNRSRPFRANAGTIAPAE